MYQKFLSKFGKFGIVIWTCLVFLKILIQLSSASVMISNEFYNRIYMFDLVVSLLVGLSIFALVVFPSARNDPSGDAQKHTVNRSWFRAIGVLIFAVFAAWITYNDLMPSIVAFSFHHATPKEEITINAEVLSVGRAHQKGTYLLKCTYWLNFSEPKLSPFSQYVCIDNVQYKYFQRANLPEDVLLYGQKSVYGYELYYRE